MLQIQKQNTFLRGEIISGAGADLTPKISGTPEQKAVMKESREQRNALATETLEKGQKNEMVKRAQAMLQKLGFYTKGLDGDYGNGTETAVKSFQSANGLNPDGKIGVNTALALVRAFQTKVGLNPDGIVGPNTLAALGGWVDTAPVRQIERTVSEPENVRVANTNPLAGFFNGIASLFAGKESIGRSFKNLGPKVDDAINATSGLETLETSIHSIRNTNNKSDIDAVYAQAMGTLKSKIPANLYKTLSSAKNTMEKAFVLSLIQNALMGGKKAPERIKENNVDSIIAADKKIGASQDREWSKYGVNMSKMRAMAHSLLKAQGSYNQENYKDNTKTVLWSLRSKNIGGKILAGLQPYSGSAIETVQLKGSTDRIPMKIPRATLEALVANLDMLQLASIKKNVLRNTRISDTVVKEMILTGKLKYSVSYAKSANCFNDAIALTFTSPVRPVGNDGSDHGNNGNDTGPSSTPGERGGWDEGGGWTDGGQGGDRG